MNDTQTLMNDTQTHILRKRRIKSVKTRDNEKIENLQQVTRFQIHLQYKLPS